MYNSSAGHPRKPWEHQLERSPSRGKPAKERFCRIQAHTSKVTPHTSSHNVHCASVCVWDPGQCEFSFYLGDCSRKTDLLLSCPPINCLQYLYIYAKYLNGPWCLFPCLYLIKMNRLSFAMLSGLATLYCVFVVMSCCSD